MSLLSEYLQVMKSIQESNRSLALHDVLSEEDTHDESDYDIKLPEAHKKSTRSIYNKMQQSGVITFDKKTQDDDNSAHAHIAGHLTANPSSSSDHPEKGVNQSQHATITIKHKGHENEESRTTARAQLAAAHVVAKSAAHRLANRVMTGDEHAAYLNKAEHYKKQAEAHPENSLVRKYMDAEHNRHLAMAKSVEAGENSPAYKSAIELMKHHNDMAAHHASQIGHENPKSLIQQHVREIQAEVHKARQAEPAKEAAHVAHLAGLDELRTAYRADRVKKHEANIEAAAKKAEAKRLAKEKEKAEKKATREKIAAEIAAQEAEHTPEKVASKIQPKIRKKGEQPAHADADDSEE